MSDGTPEQSRIFAAPDGARWEACVVSRGAASGYLSAKVGRPIVQFTKLAEPAGPPRYAPLAGESLAALDEGALAALWGRARIY